MKGLSLFMCRASTQQRQKLLDILLAKGDLIVIDHQAGDAHDLVALLQLLKMG